LFSTARTILRPLLGREGYFKPGDTSATVGHAAYLGTNFITDIQSASIDKREVKGAGVSITQFELAGNSLIGHLAQWPRGDTTRRITMALEQILLGLQSSGYVLLWSKEIGTRPYEAGRSADVVEDEWKAAVSTARRADGFTSISTPGRNRRANLALRYGSRITTWILRLPTNAAKTEFTSTSSEAAH